MSIQTAVFYSIMADESADVSNKEQLVICLRWMDQNCFAHEEFIGMHPLTGDQGRREGGAEGAVCPRASGSKGPHQLISKFLS